MIAFVTGGTGFVGGHLCERLRAQGWEVRALVRKSSRTETLEACGCRILRAALLSPAAYSRAIAGADVVFHLAGATKALTESEFLRINGSGTEAVMEAARRAHFTGRAVVLSSLAAAGPAHGPHQPRTEADEPRPVSAYGRSKLLGERHARRARRHFPVAILRPGAIYGPREHEIFQIVRGVARTGFALRVGPDVAVQMTHVDDIVAALQSAATTDTALNRSYFITDRQVWRFSQVMGLLGEALGCRVRQVPLPTWAGWVAALGVDAASRLARRPLAPFNGDKMRELTAGDWIADSALFTRDTGWQAVRALPEGLHETVCWYRDNGWLG